MPILLTFECCGAGRGTPTRSTRGSRAGTTATRTTRARSSALVFAARGGGVHFSYLVIDLFDGPTATNYPVSFLDAAPPGGWSDEYKTTKLVMRRIPAGTFTMGGRAADYPSANDEDLHQVTLTKDFFIGIFEVTQKQWERVMGNWPGFFTNATYRESRPVESVSYYDIRESTNNTHDAVVDWPSNSAVCPESFIGKLRTKTGLTTLDLPTESQWEYACRAGTTTALNSGQNLTNTSSDAAMNVAGRYWYNGGMGHSQGGDTSVGTAKAGSYQANAWDVYEMHGGVNEWCLDWYWTYPDAAVTDPAGAATGSHRVLRSGSWNNSARFCRSANRSISSPNNLDNSHGFRVARTLP